VGLPSYQRPDIYTVAFADGSLAEYSGGDTLLEALPFVLVHLQILIKELNFLILLLHAKILLIPVNSFVGILNSAVSTRHETKFIFMTVFYIMSPRMVFLHSLPLHL